MFFTNQAGIEKGKMKPQEIMRKVEDIIDKLDIPILVWVQLSFGIPFPAIWHSLNKLFFLVNYVTVTMSYKNHCGYTYNKYMYDDLFLLRHLFQLAPLTLGSQVQWCGIIWSRNATMM